jgi:hypothetical protein
MPRRSPWLWTETWPNESVEPVEAQLFLRNVGDGILAAVVSFSDRDGWNLCLNFKGHDTYTRYPTWEELLDAATELMPDEYDYAAQVMEAQEGHISTIIINQLATPPGEQNG